MLEDTSTMFKKYVKWIWGKKSAKKKQAGFGYNRSLSDQKFTLTNAMNITFQVNVERKRPTPGIPKKMISLIRMTIEKNTERGNIESKEF